MKRPLFLKTALKKKSCTTKGQLTSERNFGVFKSPKKRTKVLKDFCPSL